MAASSASKVADAAHSDIDSSDSDSEAAEHEKRQKEEADDGNQRNQTPMMDEAMAVFCDMIRTNQSLRHIDFNFNHMNEEHALALMDGLERNDTLDELNVSIGLPQRLFEQLSRVRTKGTKGSKGSSRGKMKGKKGKGMSSTMKGPITPRDDEQLGTLMSQTM